MGEFDELKSSTIARKWRVYADEPGKDSFYLGHALELELLLDGGECWGKLVVFTRRDIIKPIVLEPVWTIARLIKSSDGGESTLREMLEEAKVLEGSLETLNIRLLQ